MNTRTSIEKECKDILNRELGIKQEDIKDTSTFIEQMGADTLDIIEICMECEAVFNITIPDEKWDDVRNFKEMVDLVEECVNGQS